MRDVNTILETDGHVCCNCLRRRGDQGPACLLVLGQAHGLEMPGHAAHEVIGRAERGKVG